MNSDSTIPQLIPLKGDPARQAFDAIRGYVYQFWHSVYAWITLDDDDILYLEVAEDFDTLAKNAATSVQVKDIGKNITLRTTEVVDAIGHYWQLQHDNSDRELSFYFLTSSHIGLEDGSPFGRGVKGLELWKHCSEHSPEIKTLRHFLLHELEGFKLDEQAVERLTKEDTIFEQLAPLAEKRGYLTREDFWKTIEGLIGSQDPTTYSPLILKHVKTIRSLPKDLREFLSTSDDHTFFEHLIKPITWKTGGGNAASVEELIEDTLTQYGRETYHHRHPSDSLKAVATLFQEVARIANFPKAEQRFLKKTRFEQIFEEATSIRVPLQQYRETQDLLNNVLTRLLTHFEGSDLSRTLEIVSSMHEGIPPLPQNIAPRSHLVKAFHSSLQNTGLLVLTGLSGVGKTTLAKMVAQSQHGIWYWIDLSHRTVEHTVFIFQQLIARIRQTHESINIVLDAFHLSGSHSQQYEDFLGGLLYIVAEMHGRIIMTSQHPLPQRLSRNLGISPQSHQTIPSFEPDEISTFALQLGCPQKITAMNWTKVLVVKTQGHPQMVHAWLTHLAKNHWPEPDMDAFFETPPAVTQEQGEIQQQLSQQLSPEEQQLISRLSIITGRFKRDHAIALGEEALDEVRPALTYPGIIFEQLVGPWIEALDMGYYQVSPVLQNAVKRVWSEQRIQTLHAVVGQIFLQSKPLTTIEGANAFFHAWWGRSVETLAPLLQSFLTASPKVWEYVARDLSWFMHFGIKIRKPLFPEETWLNSMLRLLQFEIAVKIAPEKAPLIVDVWDSEIVQHEPHQSFLVERLMLAIKVLIRTQVDIPAKRLLSFLVEVAGIQEQSEEVMSMCRRIESSITDERDDFITFLFSFIVYRCSDMHFLSMLLDGLDETPATIRERMLVVFNIPGTYARLLINPVWMHEADRENPDWSECIRVLHKTRERALLWDTPSLAIEATRAIAIVYDEYLNDSPKALATLDQTAAQIEESSNLLEYSRTFIFFNQKAYEKVLAILEPLLPEWFPSDEHGDSISMLACREAGVSAAYLGNWSKAAHFFMEGYQRAQVFKWNDHIVGFLADAGFALFKAGEFPVSLKTFKNTLKAIEEFFEFEKDLDSIIVRKKVEYVLLWIQNSLAKTHFTELAEPLPGMCSNPERTEEIREQPLSPAALSWAYLAVIEFSLGFDSSIFQDVYCRFVRDQPIAKTLPLIHSQNLLAQLDIKYAFRTGQFDTLPAQLALCQNLFQASREAVMKEKELFNNTEMDMQLEKYAVFPSTFIVDHFFIALVAVIAKNTFIPEHLQIWRVGIAGQAFQDTILVWLELVETTLSHTISETIVAMKNAHESHEKRLLSALNLCLAEHLHPGDLFYAHAILMSTLLQKRLYLHEIADYLAEMLSRQWLKKCQFRAALNMPNLTVPAIEVACRTEMPGLQKVAQILLAASEAVSVTLPQELSKQFHELATSFL